MPDITQDPLVYSRHVERTVNRGPRTIHNWVKKGLLPKPMKIEGQNAWFRSEIQAALDRFAESAK